MTRFLTSSQLLLILVALFACTQVTYAVPPDSVNIGIIGDGGIGTAWTATILIAEINASPDILPRTKLNFTYIESALNNAPDQAGMVGRMNYLLKDSPAGTIGARYSDDSKMQAWMSQSLSIPQISYGSVLGEFSSKTAYPYFSRVSPDANIEMLQVAALCVFHGWMKVGVLYTGDITGAAMFVAFGKIAKVRGIKILVSTIFTDSGSTQADLDYGMQVLAASPARVFIDLANYANLRTGFTTAQIKAGLREPGIQWIVSHAGLTSLDPKLLPNIVGQLSFGIAPVLERPVWIDYKARIQAFTPDPSPAIEAMKGKPYTKTQALIDSSSLLQCQFYDAIKLMALALHDIYELRNFSGNDTARGAQLNDAIHKQKFDGCQAYITLNSNGDLLVPWTVVQTPYPWQNASGIGSFILTNASQSSIYTFQPNAAKPYAWPNGVIPLDTLQREIYQNSMSVRYGMIGGTVAVMALVILVMIIIAVFSTSPVIKATSHPFTQLSLLGALLIASSVIARMMMVNGSSPKTINDTAAHLNDAGQMDNEDLSWQTQAKSAAVAEMYLINLGYYLLVGSLLVKTWRISRIFNMRKIGTVKNTGDITLFAVLIALLLAEIAVMIGLQYGDEFTFEFVNYNDNTDIHKITRKHGATAVAFPVIYVFRFLILLPTCFFTVQVRNIPAAFNEALQLLVTVYNLAFMSILLPILEATMNQSTDAGLIAHGVVVFFIVASTSGILTIPKLMSLHDLSSSGKNNQTTGSHNSNPTHSSDKSSSKPGGSTGTLAGGSTGIAAGTVPGSATSPTNKRRPMPQTNSSTTQNTEMAPVRGSLSARPSFQPVQQPQHQSQRAPSVDHASERVMTPPMTPSVAEGTVVSPNDVQLHSSRSSGGVTMHVQTDENAVMAASSPSPSPVGTEEPVSVE